MKKLGTNFSYSMGLCLLSPIVLSFPVNNYPRFLLVITGVSLTLALVFTLLNKQTDKLISFFKTGKVNKS